MSSESDVALLERILAELRALRTIPSTAVSLRAASVEDSVAFIRADRRFRPLPWSYNNPQALRIALRAAPAWDGLVAEFGVHTGRTLQIIARHFPEHRRTRLRQLPRSARTMDGEPGGCRGVRRGWGAPRHRCEQRRIPRRLVHQHCPGFRPGDIPAGPFRPSGRRPVQLHQHGPDRLADRFVDGTVVVFDEYFGYHGWPHHEHKAFTELLEARELSFEAIAIGHMSLGVRLVCRPAAAGIGRAWPSAR